MKATINTFLIFILLFSSSCYAIINGTEINDDDVFSKSVVALQMSETQEDGSIRHYQGTGIIISERIVLTAGHNFYYLPDPTISAAIFSTTPAWGDNPENQIRIKIKKTIVYPDFRQTKSGTEDDLALVLLETPIPSNYKPIAIASVTSNIPFIGETGISIGYGINQELPSRPPLSSLRLRKTTEPLISYSGKTFIESSKLWFDQSASGFCSGDSGGPLVLMKESNPIVYGIAIHVGHDRHGNMACLTQGAFTNIAHYRGWIEETAKKLLDNA